MVPNGWKLGVISDLADTIMGYAFKSTDFTKTGIPLLRMGNLYQNALSFDRNPIYLPESFKNEYERFLVKPNDLVMSMTGTMGKRDYGFTVEIPTDAPYSLLNQRVIKFVPKHKSSSGFLLNLLRSEIVLSRLYAIPGGTKQANLSAKQIQELPAPIPPLPEQRKIAKILSTWDKAISTTDRLIDNSKQQKKALMQQLLTGKKRLLDDSGKPYEGEWELERFEQLFDIEIGGTPSRRKDSYWDLKHETNNNWLSIADLKGKFITRTSEKISDLGVKNSNVTLIPKGTIVMSFKLTIGRRAFLDIDSYTNEAICALLIKEQDKVDNNYLFQALELVDFNQEIDQAVKGKTLNKAKLKRLKLLLPSFEEQQKIASVLDHADKEIELLEQQLADLKQEKKALMQQLLTGKRRVKVDDEAAA